MPCHFETNSDQMSSKSLPGLFLDKTAQMMRGYANVLRDRVESKVWVGVRTFQIRERHSNPKAHPPYRRLAPVLTDVKSWPVNRASQRQRRSFSASQNTHFFLLRLTSAVSIPETKTTIRSGIDPETLEQLPGWRLTRMGNATHDLANRTETFLQIVVGRKAASILDALFT
jgi:hypothetical protein